MSDQVLAGFNVDDVDNVDQSTVESNDIQFPIIQWCYGDPRLKQIGRQPGYTGGWFIAETMAPSDLSQFGWNNATLTHDDGSTTDGYYVERMTISVIRERHRWEVQDERNRRTLNYAWKDYERAKEVGSPKGRNHVLVLIQGLEEFGPFCLTLKGVAGLYFNGSRTVKGALTAFDGTVLRAANEMLKKSGKKALMPRRAFWLTVGILTDAKNNPIFTKVGEGDKSRQVNLPVAIDLPEKHTEVDLNASYVGRALLDETERIYKEADPWATAWDEIKPGSSAAGNEESQATAAPVAANGVAVTDDVVEGLGL
jgi:hypothetical protein